MSRFCLMFCLTTAIVSFSEITLHAAGYGDVKGTITFSGAIPTAKETNTAGKDANYCGNSIAGDDLIVDPKTMGIANCVIWLQRKPAQIHPDFDKPAQQKIKFDNKKCVFEPHCLVVQTNQVVNGINSDGCAHNIKTAPFNNTGENPILQPSDQVGYDFKFTKAERVPFPVECNIHSWMKAYWLVIDHPYYAVSDKEGKYSIPKLPEGDHTFYVWHEKVGFLERSLKVKVVDGNVSEVVTTAAADKFK